jgi:FAD/FMN-containing dehydrogenase
MLDRRSLLKTAAAFALLQPGGSRPPAKSTGVLVNDVHSQLNPTRVDRIVRIDSVPALQETLSMARRRGRSVSISGGRHAMGSQQFGTGSILLDMRGLGRVLRFDADEGIVEVEAGIEWPELVGELTSAQAGRDRQWGIAQKQTGADRLTLGGALAANVHGRGLKMRPIVGDVESFVLVDASGEARRCSRSENPELFRLVIGGYGLFGVVASVRLRLAPRRKLERIVEVRTVTELPSAFENRISNSYLYGDFQFAIDERSEDFLRKGIFSCYRPVDPATPIPVGQRELSEGDWSGLLYLAHFDKTQAFERYVRHYLASSGQIYWSDTHQLSTYIDDYHRDLDRRLGARSQATEMITEIYVPRARLVDFLDEAREDFRRNGVSLIYGTIRLIERDGESFLAWAKQPYACTIFNLHVEHTPAGKARAAGAFRRLIEMAIRREGSYFLTYHKWATRDQVEACYPQFPEFLRRKRQLDPEERFQSDWYRHYRTMFAGAGKSAA